MTFRYVFDECLSPDLAHALQLREPTLDVAFVGKGGVLPKQTQDPEIILWCEVHDYILITINRQTMPGHLADHLAAGRHIPGVFQVPDGWSAESLFDELLLIAGAGFAGEYADQIRYLPISE